MDIDFKSLLAGLLRSGLNQSQIAERVSCGQSTISDLLSGSSREPRFGLGMKLVALARAQQVPVTERCAAEQQGERHAA